MHAFSNKNQLVSLWKIKAVSFLHRYVFKLRNVGTSRRSTSRPFGEEKYESVHMGNTLASRTLLLMMVAHALGCVWILEQPKGSLMENLPTFQEVLQKIPVWRHTLQITAASAQHPLFRVQNGTKVPWYTITTFDGLGLKDALQQSVMPSCPFGCWTMQLHSSLLSITCITDRMRRFFRFVRSSISSWLSIPVWKM